MPRPFNAAVETKSTGGRILSSDCHTFALLDYRTVLEFMTLRLADSAVSRASGRRFSFKIRGTNCGIPCRKLGRRLGLFILSPPHLASEHWVVPNGCLPLHKGCNVLQPRRPSALNNLIVFVLPFDDENTFKLYKLIQVCKLNAHFDKQIEVFPSNVLSCPLVNNHVDMNILLFTLLYVY